MSEKEQECYYVVTRDEATADVVEKVFESLNPAMEYVEEKLKEQLWFTIQKSPVRCVIGACYRIKGIVK